MLCALACAARTSKLRFGHGIRQPGGNKAGERKHTNTGVHNGIEINRLNGNNNGIDTCTTSNHDDDDETTTTTCGCCVPSGRGDTARARGSA